MSKEVIKKTGKNSFFRKKYKGFRDTAEKNERAERTEEKSMDSSWNARICNVCDYFFIG